MTSLVSRRHYNYPEVVLYGNQNNMYAYVNPPSLGLHYSITSVNGIKGVVEVQRILAPAYDGPEIIQGGTYPLSSRDIAWICKINAGVNLQVENIYKIANRLGWQAKGEGLDCFSEFSKWILETYKTGHLELNLSGLGLTLIPLHIGLFSQLENLDLSNNNIRILPVELQNLNSLKTIDLRNNPIVEIPSWLEKMAHVEVKTDIIKMDPNCFAQFY